MIGKEENICTYFNFANDFEGQFGMIILHACVFWYSSVNENWQVTRVIKEILKDEGSKVHVMEKKKLIKKRSLKWLVRE